MSDIHVALTTTGHTVAASEEFLKVTKDADIPVCVANIDGTRHIQWFLNSLPLT